MNSIRIVILQFDNGLWVDIARGDASEREAIAEFTGRCLAADDPPRLPLTQAVTATIPRDRLALLLNGMAAATSAAEPVRHPIPIAGLHGAMRSYWGKAISGASPKIVSDAQDELRRFFKHYETEITFGDGRGTLWATPEQVWKGDGK